MKYLLVYIAAAGFAVPAFAQNPDFASIDVDQSGGLSLPELQAVFPDTTEETLQAVDTDGSGDLSPEEYAAATGG